MTVAEIREILRCILAGSEAAFGKKVECPECRYSSTCSDITGHLQTIKEKSHV